MNVFQVITLENFNDYCLYNGNFNVLVSFKDLNQTVDFRVESLYSAKLNSESMVILVYNSEDLLSL